MSGRRFLDAAKLFNASRGIAKHHLALRSQQLDAFNKTSTLAKAVKNQTDRVTLTAQAGVALARKLNEEVPAYSYSTSYPPPQSQAQPSAQTSNDEAIPQDESVGKGWDDAGYGREGIEQDHHYVAEEKNATVDDIPVGDLEVRQESDTQRPTPDGTIPTTNAAFEQGTLEKYRFASHELSPEGARQFQRQSEAQIPSVTSTDSSQPPSDKLAADHDQDVYYERSTTTNHDYSSLPRAKIPKNTGQAQQGGKNLDERGINADTFYSVGGSEEARHALASEQELPPGVDLNVFRTSKGSSLLGSNLTKEKNKPKILPEAEEEMRRFAADMAKDAESSNEGGMNEAPQPTPFQMRESRVPSSRLGRLWEYSGLATSMALGAVGESLRRVTGGDASGSLMLSPANMERLVAKLSRMRGAALKLGQMISFQDLKMLPPPIHAVLQRVQDSADYMPPSQRDRVLVDNLGPDWRALFSSFTEVPIAAASIGQVHKAILASTGQEVAVKIQYPGVAGSIDSDLNNLSILLTASRLLPSGLFLDRTIANARTELAWECDYIREAECATRFKELISDEPDIFTVPAVIPEASGSTVMTAELMHGTAVTKLTNLSQDERDWIGTQILRLCLREITEFKFMQTDPNWTNFLYNQSTRKLELLDFGASRDFPLEFIEPYVGILKAASHNDRAAIRDLSVTLGYLTGHESKTMEKAHIDSVLTLAEPFSQGGPEVYDFRDQTITDRVRGLIPLMVKERLAPPPEETYSLHRKLSGAFLLCARLGSQVACKDLFEQAVNKFDGAKKAE